MADGVKGSDASATGTGAVARIRGGPRYERVPQPVDMPPEATLPWAVHRIMERLGYPPDGAWNRLHGAVRAGELTPRKGSLFAPSQGPKLSKWERENLDFDFRRYQDDAQSGKPVGSLFIGRESIHPHAITIPAEEIDHWLALQAARDDAPPGSDMLCESWTYYQATAYLAYGSIEAAAQYGGPDNASDGGHSRRGRDLLYPKSSGLPGTEELRSLCGDDLAAATAAWETADAALWVAALAKMYQSMQAGSVTAYRGTAAYGLCGLIDPVPAATWARGLSVAETCRFLPGELMSLIEGRAAGHATSGAAAEPLRAGAGRPVAQAPSSPPYWKPLIDALEWADSALGADAWGLLIEWNQSDELPMRGRADGKTQAFQCHWFDYRAWWGPAADADGEIPSSDRPRRTRPDPAMTNRLAPRPSRSTMDDILWFDQSAARAKGVDVPNRVSNILVEMTALRRLVREWSEQDIFRDVSEARTAEAEAGQTKVDVPPVGFMFIDTAVEQIKERLRISEGPALKRLVDIMHTGEVRTWKRTRKGLNGREKILPAAWEGAHVDLDVFRAREQSGILFCGGHYHLHRFLISEEDLACWLSRAAPMTQAEIRPPGVAAAAVPADAPVLGKAAEPVAESIGIETAPVAPTEAQEGDRQRCPWKQEDFEEARDRLPLLVEWAKWKYGAGPFPSRERILDDHRSAFGQVLGISEPLIRQLLRKIAPDRKGGAPAHRDSPDA